MTTQEMLIAAKAELLKRGWCQGTFRSEIGEVCMVGALSDALAGGDYRLLSENPDAPLRYLQQAISRRDIPYWNDTPGRTPEEVLAAFDRAIALAAVPEAVTA